MPAKIKSPRDGHDGRRSETSSGPSTICLSMIVKNEANVIERCLASVLPVIDYWIIVDTGSTDGTQEIIRQYMSNIPGCLIEEPWQDFAHNRSQALLHSRSKADFSLIIDADDVLDLPADLQGGKGDLDLQADGYKLGFSHSGCSYERIQVVNNRLSWCFKGVVHETIHCNDGETKIERLPWTIKYMADGKRHSTPDTYRRDAEILEMALLSEEDAHMRARYTFYLAQSWRDCGEKEKALAAYQQRAEMGFWNEEVFMSLLQTGRLQLALSHDVDEVLQSFALASSKCPYRAEASHDAARLLRTLGRFKEGHSIASSAARTAASIPAQGLFVENWIYDYGLKDELSVHAYHTGHFNECLSLSIDLLSMDGLSSEYRQRFAANARFALDKLAES